MELDPDRERMIKMLLGAKVLHDLGFSLASDEHKFKMLLALGQVKCSNNTALRDATAYGIVRQIKLKAVLNQLDMFDDYQFVNIVLTDGEDTCSKITSVEIRQFFGQLREELGDLCRTYFVGVGLDHKAKQELNGIAQYGKDSCRVMNAADADIGKVFKEIQLEIGIQQQIGVMVNANGEAAVFRGNQLQLRASRRKYMVLLTLDVSGSMAGGRWRRVVEAVTIFFRSMTDDDIFSVILFNNEIRCLQVE